MKPESIGLVGAGKFADAALFRALRLTGRLGPVKAPSVRLASRIANTLRAGHPVADYDEFDRCSLILLRVADGLVPDVVAGLSSQSFRWDRKAVVLCSPHGGSEQLNRLAALGAHAGSLCSIPGFEQHWILVEGDRLVETQILLLVDTQSTRLTAIQPLSKPFYRAALACTGSLFGSMLNTASEALEHAGVPAAHVRSILEKQIERSARNYFKAGKKAHPDPAAELLAGFLKEILRAHGSRPSR